MKISNVIPLILFWSAGAVAADEIATTATNLLDLGIAGSALGLAGGVIWFAVRVIDAKTGWLEKIPGNVVESSDTTKTLASLGSKIDALTVKVDDAASLAEMVHLHDRILAHPDLGLPLPKRVELLESQLHVIADTKVLMQEVTDVLGLLAGPIGGRGPNGAG